MSETSDRFEEKPPEERIEEIEKERERRLDPDNRPERAEIDNSDAELPTVEAFNAEHDDGMEGSAGTSDPSEKFRQMEVSEEEIREIEEERKRRLDPDNRPANSEIDNTGDNMPDVARDDPEE